MIRISSTIDGSGRVVAPDPRQAIHAVYTLRGSVARLELPDDVRARAATSLDEIEGALREPEPDREVVSSTFERFTELLDAAGTDVCDPSLIRPIRAIATWLGPSAASFVIHRL